ncbi:hypothetical protein EOD41_12405 [Mucilaginibacter limnophilus]|uniref:Uncharacterized protein n=1 Tax=Mucilaginibacter limnophilus TaxID=1932778 RepID=A0A437MRL0_9SPHI|nr:hypothetical protein [Mucilaginibacter limnophilus]RVU00279.1 hypothetical protein EOD41_12405 [Mucilaginibacter limnophilus]
MKKADRLPWESSIKQLKYREVVNPLLVINEIFVVDWVYGHKKKLKKWRYFVTHDKSYCDKNHGAGSLLFTYDLNIRLLESCYLLYHADTTGNIVITATEVEKEKLELDWYPKNLTKKELLNPLKTMRDVFKKTGIDQYRDQLHEWLYAALYVKGGNDELHYKEIRKVHRMMLKVYSAVWLIYHRTVVKHQ